MHKVTPTVALVAATKIEDSGLADMLERVPGGDATVWQTDAESDSEELVEVMGRLCYRSFVPGLNPNVKKVREGSAVYLRNIIKVGHGSVLEHASASFVFQNVSRVFTHELVRHRVGVAISQESLRYVRLDDLGMWIPDEEWNALGKEVQHALECHIRCAEELQVEMAKKFCLDDPNVDFAFKKRATSFMRRFAPIGLATAIGWSANLRTLRHVLQMRTSRHAEVEIRLVFDEVAKICLHEFPGVFDDFSRQEVNGYGEWTTPNVKV